MNDYLKTHKWEVPLYLFAAGLPLIVYFYVGYTGLESQPWFPNQSTWTDFFLYGKSRCVHFMGLGMAMLLIFWGIRKQNVRFGREWFLVLLLGILELISAFSSDLPQDSFYGGIGQYESIWVLLGYLVIGAYAYQCMMKNGSPRLLIGALGVGVCLSCVIGLTQLFQMDFWESMLGKAILVPETFSQLREKLRFSFSTDSWKAVYLAMYNPNYAGIYLLMFLPVMFLCEKRYVRILTVPVGVCMIATMSRTVWAAAIGVFVCGIVLFWDMLSAKKRKIAVATAAVAGILFTGVLLSNMFSADIESQTRLEEVVCEKDAVKITYQGVTIWLRDIEVEDGGVTYEITYEDGSHVALKWNENSGELEPYAEELQGLTFQVYRKDGIAYAMFRYQEIPFRFTKDMGTGKYEYVSINGQIDEIVAAETIFGGHDDFLSGRGYIWSRTLPLLLESPLLGTGPDSFLKVFVQDDYVARANLGHGFFTQILTNAHNLYLNIAVQTGILSLLCFLAFVIVYLKRSWKIYRKKDTYTELEKLGAGIFLGVIGYLICGLTYASSVCTTPFFWILLGCGTAINRKIH